LLVHELLTETGLERFYDLERHPGIRVKTSPKREQWAFLDDPVLQAKLVDFTDGKTSRVTFHIPAIHCVACVWLLENLFRLLPGVGTSQVNFPRREVSISFAAKRVRLSELVTLLVSIGYEPQLHLGELDKPEAPSASRRLWLQIGLAGFAFGNIMLFSLPNYLGLDTFSGPAFQTLFGYLSLVLAAPVLMYGALDYWRSAYISVRQRILTLDVPIALGLTTLYAESTFEVLSGRGAGYADSLTGLVFFLLCGRVFQQRTHERIVFDRDFKSFFPLSVTRRTSTGDENVGLIHLEVGDRLLIRNGELIPADAHLLKGAALIDYSFVTGESEPVSKMPGDYLYAGGQQSGSAIEVQVVKPVSQSYLTSLWNHEAFRKERNDKLNTLTNRYSRRFTRLVIGVACAAALFWAISGDLGRGIKAFTSVLIVACPCALALAAPFALGTAQRLLARVQIFLKNVMVLERLAEIDAIVFDKTGTLTAPHSSKVAFYTAAKSFSPSRWPCTNDPTPELFPFKELTPTERKWVRRLLKHSTHPYSRRIANYLTTSNELEIKTGPVAEFYEIPGCGLEGSVDGHQIRLGSRTWLERCQVEVPALDIPPGSNAYLSIDGHFRGAFVLANVLRPQTERLLAELKHGYELVLLSGDNERERTTFANLFGEKARLHFNQSPVEKLRIIEGLKRSGRSVMMVGDGLNDAGALKQSDVGVAVVEQIGHFSPASDVILEAGQVPQLFRLLAFARSATRVVRLSFGISAAYNLIGIGIASSGILSPLVCAVLMPLSSISVVMFACGMSTWAINRAGLASVSHPTADPGTVNPLRASLGIFPAQSRALLSTT
jgi:Cu+-exporting ATPase